MQNGRLNIFDTEKSILYQLVFLRIFSFKFVIAKFSVLYTFERAFPLEIKDLEMHSHCAGCLLTLLSGTFETRNLLSPLCGLHPHEKINLNIF